MKPAGLTTTTIPQHFAYKVGVSDPLARYARVSPSRGGEYSSRNARVNPLLVRRGGRSHRLFVQSHSVAWNLGLLSRPRWRW
jgi:hypothetical protein